MKNKNKIRLTFNRENFDIVKIKDFISEFFLNHSEIVFMIFFAIMVALSGLLIYKYIYSSAWSRERENSYLQELRKGDIDFELNEFNVVIEGVKNRNQLYGQESTKQVRDIFGIEK